MIRKYISDTVLSAEKLPPELVDLRDDIAAIPTADGKLRAVERWTDIFLNMMNEGGTTDEGRTAEASPRSDTGC